MDNLPTFKFQYDKAGVKGVCLIPGCYFKTKYHASAGQAGVRLQAHRQTAVAHRKEEEETDD